MRERVVFFISAMVAVGIITAITVAQAIDRVAVAERAAARSEGR